TRVAHMHAGVVEPLLNIEDFEAGTLGVEIGDMQCIAMTKSGRMQTLTIVVNDTGAVNDFIPTVAIYIGNANVVVALTRIREIARCAVVTVERPQPRQLTVIKIPRGKNRSRIVSAGHDKAGTLTVEVSDAGEEPVAAVAIPVAPDLFDLVGGSRKGVGMTRRDEVRRMRSSTCTFVEHRKILGSSKNVPLFISVVRGGIA